MKERKEIDKEFLWDLTQYAKDDADFELRLKKIAPRYKEFKIFENKLADDKLLFECLEKENEIGNEISLLATYASLRLCEDNANRNANEMNEKISTVISKFSTATSFVDVEVCKFKQERLQSLQEDCVFANYKRYFHAALKDKKHMLSKKEELMLSKMGEFLGGFSENFDKFVDVDLKFDKIKDSAGKEYEFSQSKYSIYAESEDRTLRENAFREMNGRHGKYINFLANNYITDVKQTCIFSKMRKYKSALAAAIDNEEASEKVYKLLIKKVRQNTPVLHDYFEIKRKILGLDKFAVYDAFAPVTKEGTKKYSYDEAIEMIKSATAVLGGEYVSLVEASRADRWTDLLPNKNKSTGAFSTGAYGANPVVLMNFEGDLEGVFTLAHELGHANHTYFSHKHQPPQTSSYCIFVAEVASNVNEMLLMQDLQEKAKTKEERVRLYDKFLMSMRSSIFRQTMFSEFEEFAHKEFEKETPLTKDLLCEKYKSLNDFYHGKKVAQIDEMQFEWARIPHFYRSFYVYKYATGLICALKIVHNLKTDKSFVKKYLDFLSSGSTADPITLLKLADCDLEDEKTFDDAFDVCKDYIKKWQAEL